MMLVDWNCWSSAIGGVEKINDFDKLLCGNQYIIKLKNESEPLNIPNVYVSEFAVSEDKHTTEKRLSNNCESPSPIITPTYSP